MTEATISIPRSEFQLNISNISKLKTISSPEYLIQGIPWKIQIKKSNFEVEPSLSVFLHCTKKEKPKNWSAVARATFKLLPSDSELQPTERCTGYYVFDHNDISFGYPAFIKWKQLVDVKNAYVKDDAINFNINIEVANQNEKNKTIMLLQKTETYCDENCVSSYQMKVTNIESLLAVQSPEILIRKLPWYLTVHKNGMGALSIRFLFAPTRAGITCKTKICVKLISSSGAAKSIDEVEEKSFGYRAMHHIELVSWDELLKKQNCYVTNNAIVIKVEMRASKPEGVDPNEQATGSNAAAKRKKMECAICFELLDEQEISLPKCGHMFCTTCITDSIKVNRICPSCKIPAKLDDLRRAYLPFIN